jgi:hypothetical protein
MGLRKELSALSGKYESPRILLLGLSLNPSGVIARELPDHELPALPDGRTDEPGTEEKQGGWLRHSYSGDPDGTCIETGGYARPGTTTRASGGTNKRGTGRSLPRILGETIAIRISASIGMGIVGIANEDTEAGEAANRCPIYSLIVRGAQRVVVTIEVVQRIVRRQGYGSPVDIQGHGTS